MAKVERRHREAALALFGFTADEEWLEHGGGGHVGNRFVSAAQAIAEAEERGAARERAAVVAFMMRQSAAFRRTLEILREDGATNIDPEYEITADAMGSHAALLERLEHLKPCAESQDQGAPTSPKD